MTFATANVVADDLNLTDEEPKIPEAVADFIHACIDRLETLKVLLLLRATAPRLWSIGEVRNERLTSEYSAEISLRHLAKAGLLVRVEGRFRFQPQTADLAQQAAWLVWWYHARPNAVISLIFDGGRRPN